MTAQEVYDGLARAVEAAKPAQEYCVLWFWTDWWPMCMTKAEWSGWMQAVFSVAAICFSAHFALKQRRDNESDQIRAGEAREAEAIRTASKMIESASVAARQLLIVAKNKGGRAEIIEPAEKLESALRVLRAIDLTGLKSHEQIAPVHESEAVIAAISRHAAVYFEASDRSLGAPGNFLHHADSLVATLQKAELQIAKLPQALKWEEFFRSHSAYRPPGSASV